MNKVSLRKEFGLKRNALSDEEVVQKSRLMADHFFSSFDLYKTTTIHIFLTIPHKKEIYTDLFIKRFTSMFPEGRVVVPKLIPEKKGEMACLLLKPGMEMKSNGLGIPEPILELSVSEFEIDIVLVPMLISDHKGNRIGYGKGYYDRFLKRCRPNVVKCGLSLFEPLDEIIESDPWDVPLDCCVTPSGVHMHIKTKD